MTIQETKNVEYSSAMEHIGSLLKAYIPFVWVTTHEERRFIKSLHAEITEKQQKELWTWSAYQGLLRYDPKEKVKRASGEMDKTWQPNIALEKIDTYERLKDKKGSVFVLKDFHIVLTQPIPRMMRDLYQSFIQHQKTIIIVSPQLGHGPSGTQPGIDPTLDKQLTVVNYELPSREAIDKRIRMSINHMKKRNQKISTKLDYTDEEFNTFAMALSGLTELEIDNALITSICHLQKIDEHKLLLEKKQIVQRSNILEYIGQSTAMSEVGGLDHAKSYFDAYSDQFSPEAKAYGVDPLRGVLLTGVPGCIAGDTILKYNRGKRTDYREITVEDMYKRFNKLENRYVWNPEISTYLHSFDGQSQLVRNRVLGVLDSGMKQLVKITARLIDNTERSICLTKDHPICTSSGTYKPAKDLKLGANIFLKGTMKPQQLTGKQIHLRPKRKVIETLKFHPLAPIHEVNGIAYRRTNYARLVIEAHMNSMTTVELIDILKTDKTRALTLKYLPSNYDVHHIDEDATNDNVSNLMIIEHSEYSQLHVKTENFNVNYLQIGNVVSIKEIGIQQTYDIQMEYPHNNFVANDFVIHNTGKSLLAKAIANMWTLPLLRLDVGKVMTGLVGGSEEKMRTVISQVESISPCVLWIDEIEKSLSGTKSSNFSDGGTLSRVFGTLLTAMEERMEGVVTIATANDISALPPELIRRFNEVLFVDLPYPLERKDIFKIHLQKRKRDIKKLKLDIDKLVHATHLFTGSEIEKVVKEAIARAFRQKKKDVTTDILLNACEDTKPIALVMKEKIDVIRDWARTRARYASSFAAAANAPGAQKITTKSGKELDLDDDLDDLDEAVQTPKEKNEANFDTSGGEFAQFDGALTDNDVLDD